MELLTELKFDHRRSYVLSVAYLNIFQITFLSMLMTQYFHPFYLNAFGILGGGSNGNAHQNIYIIAAITIKMSIMGILAILTIGLNIKMLRGTMPVIAGYIKCFTYVLFLPIFFYNLNVFATSTCSFMGRSLAFINLVFALVYVALHQLVNWSYQFRQSDFCNRRLSATVNLSLLVLALIVLRIFGSLYAGIVYILRAVTSLNVLSKNACYPLVHSVNTFYSLLTLHFISIILLSEFEIIDNSLLQSFPGITFLIISAAIVCFLLTQNVIFNAKAQILRKSNLEGDKTEGEGSPEKQGQSLEQFQNQLKVLVEVLLEKQRQQANEPNSYERYWKTYNQKIFMHKNRCQEPKCQCKRVKSSHRKELDLALYIQDLIIKLNQISHAHGKEVRLKIMNIYLYIQIAKQPLKGYYEIMALKRQKNKLSTQIQIEDLTKKARQCFDQIFYKNKVQNQQLQLMKVIQCQQMITDLQEQLRLAIQNTINFLELFTYSNLKISNVQKQSAKLFKIKESIQAKITKMVNDSIESFSLNMIIFLFYRFLEVYRSREVELKKIANQQLMKKRIFQKSQVNVFGSEHGIIYIDLIEERGKIKKITKNITDFFGYAKEDMISFNINLFMPRIFGRYHARFLSNFIEKGKITLLKEKSRIVFGKNKKKFIFPANVRLKTEHLQQNQFGASALVSAVETSSQYIIANNHGRIQQISQQLYKRIFSRTLKDEVNKINRLSIYKIILSLNQHIQTYDDRSSNKIYEGLLIYSDEDNYLFDKFRCSRDMSLTQANSKTRTISLSGPSSSNEGLQNTSQKLQFLTELFKNFLLDINIFKLKGIKISYKYSRIRTSQFQLDLIEIVTLKDEVIGKDFYRELIAEMINVAEVYQIYQEHSLMARHLNEMQAMVQADNYKSDVVHKSGKLSAMEMDHNAVEKKISDQSLKDKLMSQDSFLDEEREENDDKKGGFMVQQSQASSVVGNVQNQSKKQILINAFNGKENVMSINSIACANAILLLLILLLILSAYFTCNYISQTKLLWIDHQYILNVREVMEYRLALFQVQKLINATATPNNATTTATTINVAALAFLPTLANELTNSLYALITQINSLTYHDSLMNGLYSYTVELYDPKKNVTFNCSMPQVINQLLFMFQRDGQPQIQMLRANYQTLHTSFSQFQDDKTQFLQTTNANNLQLITYLLSSYQFILLLISICSLPVYIYFKKKEFSVRSLLAYMNIKEIKKAITRLRMLNDFIKTNDNRKGGVAKLQNEINESKRKEIEDDNQAQIANKFIKITGEQQENSIFKNPFIYISLILFILFLSNISIIFFSLSSTANNIFLQSVHAKSILADLQIKPPLLINTYLSNINRFFSNQSLVTFTNATYAEGDSGFFDLVNEIAQDTSSSNYIYSMIQSDISAQICSMIDCGKYLHNSTNAHITISYLYLSMQFKNMFTYFSPQNPLNMSRAVIEKWLSSTSAPALLQWLNAIFALTTSINVDINDQYLQYESRVLMEILILAILLIPLNILVIFFVEVKFLALLNRVLKSAEHIFMHFHVSVLVENTYLTSYFNSKIKQNK